MPLDEGVETDLKFLIFEVSKQAGLSRDMLISPSPELLNKLIERDDVVSRLKNTIENKCFQCLVTLGPQDRRAVSSLRALITIASSLRTMGIYFLQVGRQTQYIKNLSFLIDFEWCVFYDFFDELFPLIHDAYEKAAIKSAQKLCHGEIKNDEQYLVAFQRLKEQLKSSGEEDDTLTMIFIIRYLERTGDAFSEIGEAILNTKVGEPLKLRSFNSLSKGLSKVGFDINAKDLDYKPILNTRSGCRIAKISSKQKAVFYKEGIKNKISEELKGYKLWEKKYPGHVAKVLWKDHRKEHSVLITEYLDGRDLLDIITRKGERMDISAADAQKRLSACLEKCWTSTKRKAKPKYNLISAMNQLLRRKHDVDLFQEGLISPKKQIDFDHLLPKMHKIENKIKIPFVVLSHGDLNIDNVMFSMDRAHPVFVDVHRSCFNDYLQDVSVFIVSNFRVPIFSKKVRQVLNTCSLEMFYTSKRFAHAHGDNTFDARLAFGLLRSFMTSTRFQFDPKFNAIMHKRAMNIMVRLVDHGSHLKEFKLSEDDFVY